jgi:hypothetical protein
VACVADSALLEGWREPARRRWSRGLWGTAGRSRIGLHDVLHHVLARIGGEQLRRLAAGAPRTFVAGSLRQSALVGSIIVLMRDIRLTGKPPAFAWLRMSVSFSARYTQ